ncbi:MAG: glutamine-hydrolyzing carbamoyl-phosphate synthase small subunit [Candidatus Altiarchaeota archaeon]|nr:glutamine-hydrolyzing carbamoyl-phosphate synthase small subunit [Candidatus Altiarchaeota archaeon]
MKKKGVLVLEDGTVVEGECFGAEGEAVGEVVFTTGMVGYQEAITDPSFKYEILVPTYPLMGNYGITPERFESQGVWMEGMVVRELCHKPSHGRIIKTLDDFLMEHGVPGLEGADTRFLTRKLRTHGSLLGILKCPYEPSDVEDLKAKLAKAKPITEVDLVDSVSTKEVVIHDTKNATHTMVLIDCGTKASIIENLVRRGIKVVQVPARTDHKKILEFEPDGIAVSNGPGDPGRAEYVIDTIKKLVDEQLPTFGICFGSQLIGLALGGKRYKMKFGHRGANQPVKDLRTKKVYITSQNHGFAIDAESLDGTGAEVSHISLNDKTVEGIRHGELPIMSVQYHPEATPGPQDTNYIFDEFIGLMKKWGK